jgi:hypothetical protein
VAPDSLEISRKLNNPLDSERSPGILPLEPRYLVVENQIKIRQPSSPSHFTAIFHL